MVALSWRTAAVGVVELRSRVSGSWTEWSTVEHDPDESPDGGEGSGRAGVGPVWLGTRGADALDVRVVKGALVDLELLGMRWVEPRSGTAIGAGRADAEPGGPAIAGRQDWGAGPWRGDLDGCDSQPHVMNQLRFAVVHHTATGNDYTAGQVPGILAGIYLFHTASLGWCDIAYNFLIDRFGRVWHGRSGTIATPVEGGHAKGFNNDSMGVALLGQYQPGEQPTAAQPAQAQMTALRDLLAWKFSIHGIDPAGSVRVRALGSSKYPPGTEVTIPTVVDHRDVSLTDCPGDSLRSRLPTLRAEVRDLIASSRTPDRWLPFTSPRAIAARQYRDFLGRSLTNTDQAGWASAMQRDGVGAAPLTGRLVESTEFDRRIAPVPRLYLSTFGRIPDHTGLTYWSGRFRAGTGLDRVADQFARSTEFRRTYGALDNGAFVRRVYENVLGRAVDGDGLRYWTALLDSGRTRGWVLAGLSESNEHRDRVRQNVFVIVTSEAMLGRAASTAEYQVWLSHISDDANIVDMITLYLRSSEYASRVS